MRDFYFSGTVIPAIRSAADVISLNTLAVAGHEYSVYFQLSPSVSMAPTSQKFSNLVSTWRRETILDPTPTEMFSNDAYRQIIGMGSTATPLLLHELEVKPDYWFVALESINNGINPVKPEDKGNVKAMAKAWVNWGRKNGVSF